jgi:hypothetical protein
MSSHRKYLLLSIVIYPFLMLFIYYAHLRFNLLGKFLFILIGYPLLHKFTITLYRHLFGK